MKNNYQVIVDREKCVGCGLCCKDCPNHVLELQDGKAALLSDMCLKCGHCIAICPVSAVSISGYDMNEVIAYDKTSFGIGSDIFLNTLKFRRSVRRYKDKPVERDVIERIIEAGWFAPTGSNKQNVRYIVAEESIPLLEAEGLRTFRKLVRLAGFVGKFVKLPFDFSKHKLEPGFFFHGAPTVIFIVSEDVVVTEDFDERYQAISERINNMKQKKLELVREQKMAESFQQRLDDMDACLKKTTCEVSDSAANVEAFIERAKRYTEIPELTPEILRLFIQRIEVGERSEKHSRTAEQEIRIVYRDVGVMDSVEQAETGEQRIEELPEQSNGKQKTA